MGGFSLCLHWIHGHVPLSSALSPLERLRAACNHVAAAKRAARAALAVIYERFSLPLTGGACASGCLRSCHALPLEASSQVARKLGALVAPSGGPSFCFGRCSGRDLLVHLQSSQALHREAAPACYALVTTQGLFLQRVVAKALGMCLGTGTGTDLIQYKQQVPMRLRHMLPTHAGASAWAACFVEEEVLVGAFPARGYSSVGTPFHAALRCQYAMCGVWWFRGAPDARFLKVQGRHAPATRAFTWRRHESKGYPSANLCTGGPRKCTWCA